MSNIPRLQGRKYAVMCHGGAEPLSVARLCVGVALKHAQGRLSLPEPPGRYIESRTTQDGVKLLPLRLDHLCGAASLPKHHTDPFDRVLIYQAQVENMILVSHDAVFKKYEIKVQDSAR